MFGRKNEAPAAQEQIDLQDSPVPRGSATPPGKGAPTPKRKEQVAARRRPLVPDDRKAAKKANREAMTVERAKMRRALDTGEERHLPLRDKGANRRFVRDFVDARWNVGEFLLFFALGFVVLSLVPNRSLQGIILTAFWVILAGVIIDSFLLARSLRKRMTASLNGPGRGDVWYGVTRGLQIRRMRLPKPQVSRGQYPS